MSEFLPDSSFPSAHLDEPILNPLIKEAEQILEHQHELPFPVVGQAAWNDASDNIVPITNRRAVKDVCKVFAALESEFKIHPCFVTLLDPVEYPYFLNVPQAPLESCRRVLTHAEEAIKPIISAHVRALSELTGTNVEPPPATMISSAAFHYYRVEEVYATLIESYITIRNSGGPRTVTINRSFVKGVISDGLCILWVDTLPTRWYALTYAQLRMLRDTAMMRRNGFITKETLYTGDTVLETALKESFLWQEKCLTTFANPGFEIAKSVESLAKAYLSRAGNDILAGPGDSFDAMLEKVADKERAIRGLSVDRFPTTATLAFEYYTKVLKPLEHVAQVSEVFGLQKFSGHPTIDPRVASAKSRLIAQAADPTNPSVALAMRATFTDMFVKAFISKHKRWPKLEFVKKGTEIQRLYESQVLSLSRQNYPLQEWDYVNLCKEFEYDTYENFFEIIDDKSISLMLDEKHFSWDEGDPSTNKRLVIELLKRLEVDTSKIIDLIEQDIVPVNWLICSLYPKEREFKLAARAFTMMVFEMRAFFTIHEANLSEQILKYFPSITMVDTKIEVHRRFLDITKPLNAPDLIRLLLELDLSSWNLMWRGLIVELIGQQLNGLFGLKRVYTTVHKFFERCVMMMRVAGCRPDEVEKLWPLESDLIHLFHKGGLEGIAQKLWSICTVCMIQMALKDMNISYTITDQGDNIVLAVTGARNWNVELREQLKTLADQVLKACSEAATSVHQELKPEECLVSTVVLTYSKVVYVDGVDYPTSIKALSRVHPSASIDFPSVSSYVSSIFSACYTAAETAKRPERCYWLALLHGSIYLTRLAQQGGPYVMLVRNRPYISSYEGIRLQLLWPSEMMGYPVIGPYSFFYKGGADPLSKSIASLKMLQDYLPEARQIIGAFQCPELYNLDCKLRSLIQDPYGLPVKKPPTPGDAVGEDTLGVMKSLTVNTEISQVLNFATPDYEDSLVAVLGTMTPFNPLIAHQLMEASAMGTVTSIKKMGLKTQTIQAIARTDPESDIVAKMLAAGEAEVTELWQVILRFSHLSGTLGSVFAEVEAARQRWLPCGQVPQGLTSYLPIDFELIWTSDPTIPGLVAEYSTRGDDAFYSRGPCRPYLGSATASKTADHGYRIVGRGPAKSALRAMQIVLAWCDPTPETLAFIDYLSTMRSGSSISPYVAALVGIYGGNESHRFDAFLGSRDACLMGQSAFAHYCTLFTDRAGYLSASNQDYPLMWQEFLCFAIGLCSYRWSRSKHASYGRLVIRMGDEPLLPLPDSRISFRYPDPLAPFPAINRLVQSEGIHVQRTGGPLWQSRIRLVTVPHEPYEFSAVVSLLLRAIGMRRGMDSVIDNVVKSVSTAIGLAELRGMGIRRYLEAAGCALLDTVQGIVHSEAAAVKFNANVNFLVQQYGRLLISVIEPYITHPDLMSDPVVQRLNIGPSLTYDRRYNTSRLLLSELARITTRLHHDTASVYYAAPIVVFGSDGERGTESCLIRMIRRQSTRAVLQGIISYDEGQFIIGSPIRRLTSEGYSGEAERIEDLYGILLSYKEYTRGRHLISQAAQTILLNVAESVADYQVYATKAAAEELARRYRYQASPDVIARAYVKAPIITANPVTLEQLAGASPPLSRSPTRLLWEGFEKSKGKVWSFGSGAMKTWLSLSRLFKDETVLVVGSGLGACAAAALIGGAVTVRGHDLRDHYPPGVPLAEYTPPLVRLYGQRGRYLQTEETLVTTGDWFDPTVSRMLCTLQNTPYVLVLDISTTLGFSRMVLRPAVLARFRYRLVVRMSAPRLEHEMFLGTIQTVGSVIACWQFDDAGGLVERVYEVRLSKFVWSPFVHPHEAHGVTFLPAPKERKTVEQLLMYIVSPLGGATGATVRGTLEAGLATFVGMVSSKDARPSYSAWTEALHAAAGCELLLLGTEEGFKNAIQTMRDHSLYSFSSVKDVTVLATPDLMRFLTTTVSRLLGHLNHPIAKLVFHHRT